MANALLFSSSFSNLASTGLQLAIQVDMRRHHPMGLISLALPPLPQFTRRPVDRNLEPLLSSDTVL